jgi:hypothetical protein
MYKIGAAGHPCLAERDIAKNFDMKPFDHRGRMVIGFATTYAINDYHHSVEF